MHPQSPRQHRGFGAAAVAGRVGWHALTTMHDVYDLHSEHQPSNLTINPQVLLSTLKAICTLHTLKFRMNGCVVSVLCTHVSRQDNHTEGVQRHRAARPSVPNAREGACVRVCV